MDDKKDNIILEDEKSLVLDHDYDGIQELDHPLPNWWKATFYATAIFAVFYALFYLVVGGPSLKQELAKDWEKISVKREAAAQSLDTFDMDAYQAIIAKDSSHEMGKTVYEDNCLSCHAEGGRGDIGPNLTDAYWMYAKATPETIFPIVRDGKEDNGMPAWKDMLSKEEMLAVINYIMTFKNTNVAGGKESQGELVE